MGYCTWFFDRVFGVDIGLACYDHDAAYSAGGVLLKLKADVRLMTEVWEDGDKASNPCQNAAIKVTSVLMYAAVSTVGIGFWIKTRITGT